MATAFAPRSSATMTARVVVMMTPAEKRALEDRAREFELTPSELVRRASQTYAEQHDAAALDILAEQLEHSTAALRAELAEVLARVDDRRADILRMRAERV